MGEGVGMETPQEEQTSVTVRMFIDGLRRTEEMREEIDEVFSTLNGFAVQVCLRVEHSWCDSVQRQIRLAESIRREDFLSTTVRRKFGERNCVQRNGWSGKSLDMERVWQVHSELNRVFDLFLGVFPDLRGRVSSIQKISEL